MNQIINQSGEFVLSNWTSLMWIIVLFLIGKSILRLIIRQAIKLTDDGNDELDTRMEKQAKTLGQIILTTGNVVIYIIILLMVLNLFNVDITPILAGAGILGLAIGFGAQTLVKDFMTGLFIFFEHQYSVGDKVKLGDFEGKVVKMTMRSTVLQDEDCKTFYISNGTITKVTNFSQKRFDCNV